MCMLMYVFAFTKYYLDAIEYLVFREINPQAQFLLLWYFAS